MSKRYLITEAQYTEVVNHLNLIESEEKKEIIKESVLTPTKKVVKKP